MAVVIPVTGFSRQWDHPQEKLEAVLELIATARKDGKMVTMCDSRPLLSLSNCYLCPLAAVEWSRDSDG